MPNPFAHLTDDELLALANGEPASPYAHIPDDELLAAVNAGTAESYANLAKRGALSEGLWMQGQGAAELPRTGVSLIGAGLQKFAELTGQTELAEQIRSRNAELQDPTTDAAKEIAAVPLVAAGDWMADAYGQARKAYRRDNPVRPDVQESQAGQVVQGLGQAVPMAAMGMVAPQTLIPGAVAQMHQEGLDDARAKGATDEQARLTAAAYTPAAALEALPQIKLVKRLLAPLAGKMTLRKAVGHVASQFAEEGVTEATQQAWLNAVEAAGFKPDQELTEGVLDSLLVGGLVGGATATAGLATGEATRRLAGERDAQALRDWAARLGVKPETTLPAAGKNTEPETHGDELGGDSTGKPAAGVVSPELPQGVVETETETPVGDGQSPAGTVEDEIEAELAAERAAVDAQRAQAEATARRQELGKLALPDLLGQALAPRVAGLEGKTDLDRHDFWRSMQGLAGTLARLQTMTEDGRQARSRQLDLPQMREQAGLLFPGAAPELVDAIALKLHGSRPAESVAALRTFYDFAQEQRRPYAAAAQERDAAEAQRRQEALDAEVQREREAEAAAKAEAKRTAQERATIGETGRDLEGRVADWQAVADLELEQLAASTEQDGVDPDEIAGAQAEIERRARAEGQQQPLTREQQLRLIERYGGINPAHPVHAGELATIRESDLGKNRRLWREDGNSLDRLAEQIRQDVQNGPETEADVLQWLAELAQGRTPKIYERGDIQADDIRFAAAARRAEPLTTGISAEQLAAPVRPVEAPAGQWTNDNRANNEQLRKMLAPLIGTKVGGVEITSGGLKHSARLLATPEEFRMATQLEPLLRASVPVGQPIETGEKGELLERRIAAVSIDGATMPVRFTVRKQGKQTTLYHFETAQRHSGISLRPSAERTSSRIGNGVAAPTVGELLPDVKPQADGTYTARFAANQANRPAPAESTPADPRLVRDARRRLQRLMPGLVESIELEVGDVATALRREGDRDPADHADAAYLARRRARRDLIVIAADVALRNDGRTGLSRLLHETAHAYWRTLSEKTRAALHLLYKRDLSEQWSPLWQDGELITEVSQDDIPAGSAIGLEEWFAELMAATNAEWATRRYAHPKTPGWVLDLASALRRILRQVWAKIADRKGLTGPARTEFLDRDFRAFLSRGVSAQRTDRAGQSFDRYAKAQGMLSLDTPLGIELPREIAGLMPNWRDRKLHFASRLDKALYYIGAPGNTDLRARLVDNLREQTGMSDGEIRSLARRVREALPAIVSSQPKEGIVRVPEIAPPHAEAMTGTRYAKGRTLAAIAAKWEAAGAKVDMHESDGLITLSRIQIPEERRGQGEGTQFMRELAAYADATKQTVVLSPSGDFGGDKARLGEFYRRFGFEPNRGRNRDFRHRETMQRGPRYAKAKRKPAEQTELDFTAERERFEQADAKVREIGQQLAALENSQDPETETKGKALARELNAAKRARKEAYRRAETARQIEPDPVSKALRDNPRVRELQAEKLRLAAELETARAQKRPSEALLDRRDAIEEELYRLRQQTERSLFPPPVQEPPLAFGDPNPPRNANPPKVPAGTPEPAHLRPIIIDDFAPYSGPQITERLDHLRRLADNIGADDLEGAARLAFLGRLVRETRDELDSRRSTLEHDAERAVQPRTATSAQQAREGDELALQAEQADTPTEEPEYAPTPGEDPVAEWRSQVKATEAQELAEEAQRESAEAERDAYDREAAAMIPDVPEEPFPVREGVEEVGAQVSAGTLESKSRLARWLEGVRQLLAGWRGAIPELPMFGAEAQQHQNFREGIRLMGSIPEVVQHEAQEIIADIVAPLEATSTPELRSKQARLQSLRRGLPESPEGPGRDRRLAEIRTLEAELQGDPWWIFQNVVLYGDLATRARLYRRDDGTPISLPGGLNPAEAEHLHKLWLTRAYAHPQKAAILEARKRHRAFIDRLADEIKARGFTFAEGSNTNYFPHVMLEHWDGNLARIKIGTAEDFRSYLITPVGSTKPIETDYLKAMYYHATQVLAHNRHADIVRDYVASEDIRPKLIAEARRATEERRKKDGPDAPEVTWRQIYKKSYEGKYDLYTPDLKKLALHPELVIDRDLLSKRLGIVLGSGPIQEELAKHGLSNIPLEPGEIHEMLVKGAHELWVIPKAQAEALRGIARRSSAADKLLQRVLAGFNGYWKRLTLFAPWNWPRFEFNNMVSDFEKILTTDPEMLKGMIDAGKEVHAFLRGDPDASADVREAFRLGVLDTLTAAEVDQLRKQRPFEAWETKGERNTRVAVNRLTSFFGSSRWNTMGWSKLREATFRYAKFKADLTRMRHGATPKYAGAYWKNVEALRRVGAPEDIVEIERTGRAIGRQGPGSGPVMSAQPYVLQWQEGGRRREEAFASEQGRATRRAELESRQRAADAELLGRKAAAISRATFGDYGELSPNGNALRRLFIPFYAWTETNFRYHANLLRNLRDQFTDGQLTGGQAALKLGQIAVSGSARAAIGMMLRLLFPYLLWNLWNAMFFGDDEDDLSEEDRRRTHLLLGRDSDTGKVRVVYLNTAFSDVMKWFSGPRAAALLGDVVTGRTDFGTAVDEWASYVLPDLANNAFGSLGPIVKLPYTVIARKTTFPDVTDQRTIPSYDLRRAILGNMTDQTVADWIERAVNKDYVAPRSVGEWAQQAILQVRRRDPESWAFYAIKDKAAAYEEKMTGRKEGRAAYDAPDAMVLRQFRRAIYQGDVPTAMRMYQRLLELGYTAERFEASVRAQAPLSGLPVALRAGFLASLTPYEREQLAKAERYYRKMGSMKGEGRELFPRKQDTGYHAPRPDLLQRSIGAADDEMEALLWQN